MSFETFVYAWVLVPALLFLAFLCVIVPGVVVAFVGDRLAAMARRYGADEATAHREARP